MIITCPDCGKSISDQAPACPVCGRPIHVMPTPVQVVLTAPVQTIELTSKKYKGQLLAAAILLLLSCCGSSVFFVAFSRTPSSGIPGVYTPAQNTYAPLMFLALLGVVASVIWIVIIWILIWWHHR